MIIEFLVLACSYKSKEINGRCVAGIDLTNKRMIRLVSKDNSPFAKRAIKKEYCTYGYNNVPIKELDVLEIELGEKAPVEGAQTENFFVDMPFLKRKIRNANLCELNGYFQKELYYYYPFESKGEFFYDKVYKQKTKSICLIKAWNIRSECVSQENDKWKVSFDVYSPDRKKITLTNYSFTQVNSDRYKKSFKIGKAYLLISLPSESYNDGRYYKFIAGLIDVSQKYNRNEVDEERNLWIEELFS